MVVVRPTIPFFERNRLVWYAGGELNNSVILYDNSETFEAETQPTDLTWYYARQIDERRVIMIFSAGQACKMITWSLDGSS